MFRQFPQSTLSASQTTPSHRKTSAQAHISSLDVGDIDMSQAHCVATFPPVIHIFTHLKLSMHTYHYKIIADETDAADLKCKGPLASKWVDTDSVDKETLSTGMRKCWELVAKDL